MKYWGLNALPLALGLFSTVSLCSIPGSEPGATTESPEVPDRSCTHFAPPARGCHLGGPGTYQQCLNLQASFPRTELRNQGWFPVDKRPKEVSDVVFVIRGYGGSAIFTRTGTEGASEQEAWGEFRRKHIKQVIMAALSEQTFGKIKTFAVVNAGVDERTIENVNDEIAGSEKTVADVYLEGIELNSDRISSESKLFIVVFNSVADDHLDNNRGQGEIRFSDGTVKTARYVSVSANSFISGPPGQPLEEKLVNAREEFMADAGGRNGVITQEILSGLGIKTYTRGLIGLLPHIFEDGESRAAYNIYGEFSVMRRDDNSRLEIGRLMEPDTLTMANRILWFKDYGFSGSMITAEPQALCDSDNATNLNALYILDLGDSQFMELNKGRCIKYRVNLPIVGSDGYQQLATLADAVPTSHTAIELLTQSDNDHALCSIIKGEDISVEQQ